MTTSREYEDKANHQINMIDSAGMKAIETAKLYTRLAMVAAIREQTEIIRKNGPPSSITGELL